MDKVKENKRVLSWRAHYLKYFKAMMAKEVLSFWSQVVVIGSNIQKKASSKCTISGVGCWLVMAIISNRISLKP